MAGNRIFTSGQAPGGSIAPAGVINVTDHWSASAGLAGIDDMHSYAIDPRNTQPQADVQVPKLPVAGPWINPRAPIPAGSWWRQRQASEVPGIEAGTIDPGRTAEPWDSTKRPDDPRTITVEYNRTLTQAAGPQVYYTMRPFSKQYEQRFYFGNHVSMAKGPQFGPDSFGDGKGAHRFRNTVRNIPPLLEQNLEAVNDQPPPASWANQASGIEEYW